MAKEEELELDEIDDNDPESASQLRKFAERAAAKGAKVGPLEREVAALRLGIDTDSRLGQAWLASTTVDFKDKEAVLKDATDFSPGIIKGAEVATSGEGDVATGDAVVATPDTGGQQRNALADGAVPSSAAVQDVTSASFEGSRAALDKGASYEQAAGNLIATRALATHEGTLEPLPASGRRQQ